MARIDPELVHADGDEREWQDHEHDLGNATETVRECDAVFTLAV